jgi:PAS domain-containing protein
MEVKMDTYYADPKKTDHEELETEIKIVDSNPVVSGLLDTISGLLAVIDENRQIVALNHSFLKMLGIKDPYKALGLRPGEAMNCIHKNEASGCGTTKYCSSCGAAIAIVTSLEEEKPVEKVCVLSAKKEGKKYRYAFTCKS